MLPTVVNDMSLESSKICLIGQENQDVLESSNEVGLFLLKSSRQNQQFVEIFKYHSLALFTRKLLEIP